jgi:hypothetical protein
MVLLVHLDSSLNTLVTSEISEGQGGFGASLDFMDLFGSSLASAGDVNGDGVEDLLVGAPGDDSTYLNSGAVYLLFLQASPAKPVLSFVKLAPVPPTRAGPASLRTLYLG